MSSSSTTSSRVMMDRLVDEAMELMEVANVATVYFLKTCVNEHFSTPQHRHSCESVHKEILELKKLQRTHEIYKQETSDLQKKYAHIDDILKQCMENRISTTNDEDEKSYNFLFFE